MRCVAHVGDHFVSQKGSEGSRPLGPAGGAQTATLAGEGKQELLLALWATDAGEAAVQDAAVEIAGNHPVDETSSRATL